VLAPEAGQILQLKRPHVCGSDRFAVTQVGLDIRLSCTGCGARLILSRQRLQSRLRGVVGRIGPEPSSPGET
jgi:hypothetical protein